MRYLALLPILALPLYAEAEIYRWIDADGRVHFSDQAPEKTDSHALDSKLQETGNFVDYPTTSPDLSGESEQAKPESTPTPANHELEIHFHLVDYELNQATQEEWRYALNVMYRAYRDWFGWSAKPAFPITIRIFGSVEAFEAHQRLRGKKVQDRSYYSGGRLREIVMKASHPEAARNTLLHEASHAILHMQQADTGKWINEGLAEVFSTMSIAADGEAVLVPEKKWAYIMALKLKQNQLQSAATYLAIPSQQWKETSRREENENYMLAWSLMYFLTQSTEGRKILTRILEDNRRSTLDGQHLVESIDSIYPNGLKQLNQDWRQWISQNP